jgi:eukaryotic-like serine/threonine-protein kinase
LRPALCWNSLVRSLLGSVSAKVAAEAVCTVTVVRPPVGGAAWAGTKAALAWRLILMPVR